MPRKANTIPRKVKQIEDVIYLFADYCPTGLACFMGEEYPDSDILSAMSAARWTPPADLGRIDGGAGIPPQQVVAENSIGISNIIDSIGGLETIRTVFLLYSIEKPEEAALLREMSFIGKSFKYPSVEEFAYRNHLSTRQFYRRKSVAINEIAWEIFRRGEKKRRF